MLQDVSMKKCVEFAITTEELGARFYARMAKKFGDQGDVSDLFAQLSRDEEVHKEQFSKLLSEAPDAPDVSDAPEKAQYLRAMSISEFFSHYTGPFKDRDDIENRDQALERALAFEKSTLGFYKAVEEVLGSHPTLSKIIDAERGHVTAIMKALVTGGKFRSTQDNW